jgi:hypothetical protein
MFGRRFRQLFFSIPLPCVAFPKESRETKGDCKYGLHDRIESVEPFFRRSSLSQIGQISSVRGIGRRVRREAVSISP